MLKMLNTRFRSNECPSAHGGRLLDVRLPAGGVIL
jgi:hypothetical protein